MNNALLIATFLGLFAAGLAATSSGRYSDPNHPGKCVITPDEILTPGIHANMEGCARIECHESGYANIATCGVQLAGPGCTLGDAIHPDADYPDCCERETICNES